MARSRGAVAAGHAETARAAEIILQEGGNAFDAVLGAVCAASVAEPVLCSLGGGGFLLARTAADGKAAVFDFFTQTPKARRPEGEVDFFPIVADFGAVTQEFHIGMGSIATPGLIKGVFEAHAELGRMPIREVVEPARRLARDGVALNALQAYIFSVVGPIYVSNPTILAQFESTSAPGRLAGEGDLYRAPATADALDALAHEGADLFYRGEMGRRLVEDCRSGGGYLGMADLEGYRVARRRPLEMEFGEAAILTNPPPSTGGILIAFAIELLKGTGLEGMRFGASDHLATLARAMALTNKARVDAALHETDADDVARTLLDPAFLAAYRAGVLGRPAVSRGTTHLSVIDAAGNAASLTVSNGEGAGYVLPGTGIVLNNMLGEEDINPHGFHRWPTDVRMASMMAPSVLRRRDGSLVALGSGGSNRIRTAILQVLVDLLAFQMPLEEAVPAPRLHFERGLLNLEPGFAEGEVARLRAEFPEMRAWDGLNLFFGGVHAVSRDARGGFHGTGDPRRGGVAVVVD